MHYVYLLQSTERPDKTYIGRTDDVHRRLDEHNQGDCTYTSKYRPWKIVTFIGTPSPQKAIELEGYIKSGSGHAFARRHLWT